MVSYTFSQPNPPPKHLYIYIKALVRISKLWVLEIRQIIHEIRVVGLNLQIDGTLGLQSRLVALFVAPDEQHAQTERQDDLARRAGQDHLAAGLVDGGFAGQERVRADDVAAAVGQEDKCRGRDAFGVAAHVGGGELECEDEGCDEAAGLRGG